MQLVRKKVLSKVRAQIWSQVYKSRVRYPVLHQFQAQILDQTWSQVLVQVRGQVWDQIRIGSRLKFWTKSKIKFR